MNTRNLSLRSCVCAILSAAAVSGTALAQERSGALEEIVVTAQKRQETLQETAIAVTAITSEVRDIVGIVSIQDLTDFTPGLSYSLTQDRISLRGVGRLTNNYGSDPGVATYADGFYTQSTTEAGKRPILIERTEVLRGPQGTLYGRNSIGGAINVISKRPTDNFQGELRSTVGNYGLGIVEASLSGPINDSLRFRFAGFAGHQSEGFFKDVDSDSTEGGKYNDKYVEAQVEFNVGDAFEGWVKYSRAQWDQARRTLVTITPTSIAPTYWSFVGSTPVALSPNATYNGGPAATQTVSSQYTDPNPALNDRRLYDTDTPFHAKLRDNHIFTVELIGHLDFADVKYVGGWQDYHYDQVSDFDNTDRVSYRYNPTASPTTLRPVLSTILEGFYTEEKEYYSHEINLISTNDGPVQWIGGLYYYWENVFQFLGYRSPLQTELDNPAIAAFSTVRGSPNPERNLSYAGVDLDASSTAAFGQIDWAFAQDWKATLGLRYTKDKKDAVEFRTRVIHDMPFNATATPPFVGAPGTNGTIFAPPFYSEDNRQGLLSGEWDAWTGTAGIEWTPMDDMLTFAKFTRGYKSGGFNGGNFSGGNRAATAPALPVAALIPTAPTHSNAEFPDRNTAYTEPEYINAFELGMKLTSFDRLVNNVSLFYYDYKNLQAPLTLRDSTGLNITQFYNFEKVMSLGAELESVYAATDNWQLRLTYAYLKTENKDRNCFTDSADTGATPATQAPDHRTCTIGTSVGSLQHLDGDQLPSSPEHKAAFNTNYTWHFGPGSLTASGTWTYRGSAYYALFSREHYRTPAYDETDARLIWNGKDRNYTVIGYVSNLFDDEGYERADASQATYQAATGARSLALALTAPRTYGLEVQVRFGHNK